MSDLKKKETKSKRSSVRDGRACQSKMFPTLARIVSSNGSRVDILKLPISGSALTSYENLRCALEHAAIATCSANQAASRSVPKLMLTSDWDPIRLNLEDLMNHLYYAIKDFPQSKGVA